MSTLPTSFTELPTQQRTEVLYRLLECIRADLFSEIDNIPIQIGVAGTDGTNGVDGVDGNTILSGAGAPDDTLGALGDFYLDRTTFNLYGPRGTSSWPVNFTGLIGTPGNPGLNGQDGQDGQDGNTFITNVGAPTPTTGDDGDYYMDALTGDLYGPKTNGLWGSIIGNLRGPAGQTGNDGQEGQIGPEGPPGPTGDEAALNAFINNTLPNEYVQYVSDTAKNVLANTIPVGQHVHLTDIEPKLGGLRMGATGFDQGYALISGRTLFSQSDIAGSTANRAAFTSAIFNNLIIEGGSLRISNIMMSGGYLNNAIMECPDEVTSINFGSPIGFNTESIFELGVMPSLVSVNIANVQYDEVGDNCFTDALETLSLTNTTFGEVDVEDLMSQLPDRTGLTQGTLNLTGNGVAGPIDLSTATNKNWQVIGLVSI